MDGFFISRFNAKVPWLYKKRDILLGQSIGPLEPVVHTKPSSGGR